MSDRLAHTLLLRALLLAAMLPCLPMSAAAQQARTEEAPAETAAVQTLSLREALLRASRAAPQVLAAFARADAARAQLRVASAALYPSVSASVSANVGVANGGGVSDASGAGGASASVTATGTAGLNASWLVWDFGRTAASRAAARGNETLAIADGERVQQAAIQTAASAFYGALADERVVDAAQLSVRQRTAQRDVAAGLVEVGARPPIERTRADVALSSAELDLRVAESARRSDLATLAAALALDPARPLRVLEPAPLQAPSEPAQAVDAALAARPDLRAERARVGTFEAQLRGARADYLPTISASGSLSARYALRSGGGGAGSESASATLGLSVPVFDAALPARVSAAEAQLAAARANLAGLELEVRTAAVQAAISVQNAETILAQAERLAEGTAANLAQAEGRYSAGAAAQLELLDAQTEDANARITVIRLRAQLELSKIALLAAMGRLPELTRR